ncbi:YdeI/OmpD-associated family protein [Tenacibaculum sp. 190524A02b]|uniref:YdeI/OmpD-associated family protein n=1 Tax=Tenacibaculum vairaonense TaxID=3137860 RepID=UPI0031FB1B41
MNLEVTTYIQDKKKWTQELTLLRSILIELPLEETIKWGMPAYLCKGKNIIGLGAFKEYCAIWFHQGVFLQDKLKLLINAQEGKTKAMRQWRFYSINDISINTVKEYVKEAIDNSIAGKEIKPERKNKNVIVPEELKVTLDSNDLLSQKFNLLTNGKQREFAEYISEAKRLQTKHKRLDKIIPMIIKGIGLNDKYKKSN